MPLYRYRQAKYGYKMPDLCRFVVFCLIYKYKYA